MHLLTDLYCPCSLNTQPMTNLHSPSSSPLKRLPSYSHSLKLINLSPYHYEKLVQRAIPARERLFYKYIRLSLNLLYLLMFKFNAVSYYYLFI